MPKTVRSFTSGRMNKMVDEKLVPDGEYIDALNCRVNSSEGGEMGVIENSKGNELLATILYNGTPLSTSALCIGSFADDARETIYWAIHDPAFAPSATNKLDIIASFNVNTNVLRYHVISVNEVVNGVPTNVNTTLNFDSKFPITAWDMVDDLLFFTDGKNDPRVLNINETYEVPGIGGADWGELAEALRVIKRPPSSAPTAIPIITTTGRSYNYISDRFLSFAYRYRYADNMYSATSAWSSVAFIPSLFGLDIDGYVNAGMVNRANAVRVVINTGSDFVKEIEILYKDARANIIKVAERISKAETGTISNATFDYIFTGQKVFTVLPQSELLRLYDNVPRLAVAQTIMGNRLLYGNYVEGYNITRANTPVPMAFRASLISEEIEEKVLVTGVAQSTYTINGTETVPDSLVAFDLTGIDLRQGGSITLDIVIAHDRFTAIPAPPAITPATPLTFSFFFIRDYTSVFDLATSQEFQNAVGTITNIQTVANCALGVTFTDAFNCAIPATLGTFAKTASGITAINEPISILASPTLPIIGLQLPAMQFVSGIDESYEYYKITEHSALFESSQSPKSLHSNRGYEVGMMYYDEYMRGTNALVSNSNNVFVPCSASIFQNKIRVTIPTIQRAPEWAKFYKFAIKPDKEDYETIYTSFYFNDPDSPATYFLVEGENARKVESGDRLYVKKDSTGALRGCVSCVVLEKEAKESDFIQLQNFTVPAGVYIKINAEGFSTEIDLDSIYERGGADGTTSANSFPIAVVPLYEVVSNVNIDIPIGSVIEMNFIFRRKGNRGGTGNCERRNYTLKVRLVARATYNDFKAWWEGDNVSAILNTGEVDVGGNLGINNVYESAFATTPTDISTALGTNYYKFYEDTGNANRISLLISGTRSCTGLKPSNTRSTVEATIRIIKADNAIVFETEPIDSQPDIFYEGEQTFSIDSSGFHFGNVQTQTSTVPAIVDTNFFNCFTFGNGIESYKVRDSLVGRSFLLGNRVLSTTVLEYKEIRRFADITYSGVYNNETNVNKLNEFNLGLLNFKQLERIFGSIQIIDGRETDVLVLQEDKISTVLSGKNLLSDAEAGGTIVSIPEVLGTQVARSEKFGISSNRESYVRWGGDRYFTDVKRNAVLNLKGSGAANDQLSVISDMGMENWFRDEFILKFDTQKVGGYDPYMKEYVLSSNLRLLPTAVDCIGCGVAQTFKIFSGTPITFCVNLPQYIGDVDIDYTILELTTTAEVKVDALYNTVLHTTGNVDVSGSFNFSKDEILVKTVQITASVTTGEATLQLLVNCPTPEILNVVEVVVNLDSDSGKLIHTQYNYTDGVFVSPIQSTQVQFVGGTDNPLVTRYNLISGGQGLSAIPTSGSLVTMYTDKIGIDDFDFIDGIHEFKYLRTNTVYGNNPTDIATLLGLVSTATPTIDNNPQYSSSFTFSGTGNYLYLVWDLRTSVQIDICYDTVSSRGLCCCACEPDTI